MVVFNRVPGPDTLNTIVLSALPWKVVPPSNMAAYNIVVLEPSASMLAESAVVTILEGPVEPAITSTVPCVSPSEVEVMVIAPEPPDR